MLLSSHAIRLPLMLLRTTVENALKECAASSYSFISHNVDALDAREVHSKRTHRSDSLERHSARVDVGDGEPDRIRKFPVKYWSRFTELLSLILAANSSSFAKILIRYLILVYLNRFVF